LALISLSPLFVPAPENFSDVSASELIGSHTR
jgi:hypothetical protein